MGCYYATSFVTLLILTNASTGEYGDRIKNATETTINLEMQESRYHGYAVPRPRTELPVNFQAPYANAKDYWSEPPRRTIFDYPQDSFTRPITEGLNSFYGLMNHFFGTEEPPPRRKPNYPQYPSKAPYDFEPQYHQQPYRQQYLPAPAHKPLRASVIKLEPVRATPQYAPPNVGYTTTAKYYPQFVKILNDVLVENSYKNQLAALGLEDDAVLEKPETTFVPNIVPTTYKPKQNPFTQKTTPFPGSIQDQLPPVKTGQDTRIPYVSEQSTTKHKTTTGTGKIVFHESKPTVTPLDIKIDVRNAPQYVTKSSTAPVTFEITTRHTPRITPPPSTVRTSTPVVFESTTFKAVPVTFETTTDGQTGVLSIKEPISATRQLSLTTTEASLPTAAESIGSEQSIVANLSAVPPPITTTPVPIITVTPQEDEEVNSSPREQTTTTEIPTTTATSEVETQPLLLVQPSEIRPIRTELIQNMEPLEYSRFKGPFPKRLDPRRATTDPTVSADYVTDLTIRGLTDQRRRGSVNLQSRHVSNIFNMTTVVGFEIAKLNGTAPPPQHLDLNDELSLDAKILKDTNWDGYQPPIPTITTTPQAVSTNEGEEPQKTTHLDKYQQSIPTTTIPPQAESTKKEEESQGTTPLTTIYTTTVIPTEDIIPTTAEAVYTTLGTTEIPLTTQPTPAKVENDTSVIATRITKTISRSLHARRPFGRQTERRGRSMKPPNFDERFSIGSFITESSSIEPEITKTKKYQRRVRVQTFTPYPSQLNETDSGEMTFKLGTLTRPFYPRRTRPNVTLAFGNRQAARKNDDVSQERERVRSSTRRSSRKELYRGRTYPSQLKRRTTEQSPTAIN